MQKLEVYGANRLKGQINISGSKNASLPILAATLLSKNKITLKNLPKVKDIETMLLLLKSLGVEIIEKKYKKSILIQKNRKIKIFASYNLVKTMRAGILVLGPLLAKYGKAKVSLPGGCAIGTRPVDLHLKGFEALGAKIELKEGYISAFAPNGLKAANVLFPSVSVGATENILMAATLADGKTTISNAAREPEIADLAYCLQKMGAQIEGIGSDTLTVIGKKSLHAADYQVIPDRIETATYAVAAAITGGDILLKGTRLALIESVADVLMSAGICIGEIEDGIRVSNPSGRIKGIDVMTEPYPGFPTDMQAQMMALLAVSEGASMITETIFENRFMHVPELCRMGADINVHGSSAIVRGVDRLSGAELMATDLRASISLVVAALAAQGETIINRVYHLDRGYERVEEKLTACGAEIERVEG